MNMFSFPIPIGWTRFCDIPNGGHFSDGKDRNFIKLVNKTAGGIPQTFGRIVSESEYGPKSGYLEFNSIDYDGFVASCPDWAPFKIIEKQDKITLDNSGECDKVLESKATSNVDEAMLKNKHIETTKQMQTYNTLKEAVVAAINEIKVNGTLSNYQVTQLIRNKTNQGEWEVLDSVARPNNANIKFWINRDDVRRIVNDMYANHELDALGFTGRVDNGKYLEYRFDVNAPFAPTPTVGIPNVNTPTQTSTPLPVNTTVAGQVQSFLQRHVDDVESPTLKRIQSAIKEKGVLCEDLKNVVVSLGYNVVPDKLGCPSTYYVVEP